MCGFEVPFPSLGDAVVLFHTTSACGENIGLVLHARESWLLLLPHCTTGFIPASKMLF